MDLPDAAAYGRHEWMGFVLRFTATWSGESKRTSVAPSQGGRSHSWAGEHTTLALPSVVGDSVPESELDIALCARIVGKPDEIIGAAKVSIASRSGAVSQLALLGPIFTGTNPTVSFRFDVTGVTRAQADREYSAGFGTAVPPPKTTPAPANNAAKGKPKGKGEPAKPAGLSAGAPKQEAWLRPIMAPSARMLMGLDECARIKAAFVKAGLACPTAALEKALLLPEDRPVPLCLSELPRAGPEGRPLPCKDPILPSGKGGKKGKGKKGGKKGGKKKK
ncbi:hypothetical protein Ctob_000701 [Chrysochromulina tobinii]|uniref:Uncharacterized protein n=1 Tax=Chrysochromulina tobinii TaxID=1460289 RepID=A0A0M0J7F1_9EUKA|nr:hypothetical protein Ctob_000701 [Chrysochromulina tobinii]|eukprot:KOO22158.1 hypothetical protein Ctob_000701 [Chrysochromulina sp. CCMP291]